MSILNVIVNTPGHSPKTFQLTEDKANQFITAMSEILHSGVAVVDRIEIQVLQVEWWIIAEDLARCAIGPFETYEAAEEHAIWCTDIRCDAGTTDIVAGPLTPEQHKQIGMTITPEQDRTWEVLD